jgi:hypothetical protein
MTLHAGYAASRTSSNLKGTTKQFGWLQAPATKKSFPSSTSGNPATIRIDNLRRKIPTCFLEVGAKTNGRGRLADSFLFARHPIGIIGFWANQGACRKFGIAGGLNITHYFHLVRLSGASSAATHLLGVTPRVCRKSSTKALGWR